MEVSDRAAALAGAALASLVGIVLVFLSWQPLNRLFDDDMDNNPVVYLGFGLPFLVPGVYLLWYALKTWLRLRPEASPNARE
jgi:hypothetical protein